MTNQTVNDTVTRQDPVNVDSDDEHFVDERTTLLNQQERVDGSSNAELSKSDEEHGKWANFLKWTKRDLGYALLFSVPLLLLVPSIVLFVATMNLRATLPPSESLETINNLTHRVNQLSKSLATCHSNSSRLAILLHDEEQRVEICRESEKRLAERVDVVEEMLETCKSHEASLEEQLENTEAGLNVCNNEKEELKRQMESGVFIQFLDMVGNMGTGGDSWVCSDLTKSWGYGYSTTDTPHSTITIQTWTAELNDVQHSAVPLVFPPTSATDLQGSVPKPVPTGPQAQSPQAINSAGQRRPDAKRVDTLGDNFRIIGYSVTSQNMSGNNGWWRIAKLPKFAVPGRTIEFYAMASKWYGSAAKYEVTVYWVGTA